MESVTKALMELKREIEQITDKKEKEFRSSLIEEIQHIIYYYDEHVSEYEYNKHWKHLTEKRKLLILII